MAQHLESDWARGMAVSDKRVSQGTWQCAAAAPVLAGLGMGVLTLSTGPAFAAPRKQAGLSACGARTVSCGSMRGPSVSSPTAAAPYWGFTAVAAVFAVGPAVGRRRVGRGRAGREAFLSVARASCQHPERALPKHSGLSPCAAGAFVSSAKSACIHPEREFPYLCGDCPRNGKVPHCAAVAKSERVLPGIVSAAARPCAVAAFESTCVHADQEFPHLCGDCPRNPSKAPQPPSEGQPLTVAIASAAESASIPPDPDFPSSCGNCPRSLSKALQPPCQGQRVCAAAFISTAKSACIHPDREFPYLCGDCPRN